MGITVMAHIILIIGIIGFSYNAFFVFIVYQSCAMLALIAVDVWTLAVMEISPNTSYLKDKCPKWDTKHSTNRCVRRIAAILGITSLVVTIINSSVVWPILKDYFVFLKSKECEAFSKRFSELSFYNLANEHSEAELSCALS
ncbi:hypothetical protein OESDEN_08406 [Oesophagostomum dentatum]|uniref:Uncharacterized protein n=1 Tax=Oesophagostomum dentatum TaxID=61180 RepID=A0A0B1T2G1_OESDE|nr:hypothetical protein OESDEN_08406 [Oesophagostomum dentatum]